jgi:putative ABC transport system permease protein
MITWFKIAFRNLIKNGRRSFVTSLAIGLGFAAVNLFGGFTEYMYGANREAAIYTSFRGHLNVFRTGFLEEGQLDPARYLLTAEDIKAVGQICADISEIILVTPQLRISGLASNGKVSTIFIGQGVVPSSIDVFLNRTNLSELIDIGSNALVDDKDYGVAVANDLARMLDLSMGSYAVAMSTTVNGQMNALDMEVFQLFEANSKQMNDKFMRVPFSFAQKLYDTNGADRLVILLNRAKNTERVRSKLEYAFSQNGLELDVETWMEQSEWYRRVKEMFDTIFLFLFTIVFVIAVMSIINTMTVAVLERTREIGTLRALGFKRKGVVSLFAIESSLLGFGGTLLGIFFDVLTWWCVDFFRPTWTPPGAVVRIPLKIEIVPEFMALSFLVLMVVCFLTSMIPARGAARKNVVDALGHV